MPDIAANPSIVRALQVAIRESELEIGDLAKELNGLRDSERQHIEAISKANGELLLKEERLATAQGKLATLLRVSRMGAIISWGATVTVAIAVNYLTSSGNREIGAVLLVLGALLSLLGFVITAIYSGRKASAS